MPARRFLSLAVLACLLVALAGVLTSGVAAGGGSRQGLEKAAGIECLTFRNESWGCEKGSLLGGDAHLAISPDGLNGYEVFWSPVEQASALHVFDRDPETGSLVQKPGIAGCIANRPRKGCLRGRAIEYGSETMISPDGKNVYMSDGESLEIFDRDPAGGALVQKPGSEGCIDADPGADARDCARISSLGGIWEMAISPDGRYIYVASSAALVRLDRDPSTGALSLASGPDARIRGAAQSDIAISPDGANLYALTFRRLGSRLKTFVRDPATGALTRVPGRVGCVSERGVGGCRYGRAMFGGYLIISPDGRNLYAANSGGAVKGSGDLLTFDRLADGTLAQKRGEAGCISQREEGYDEGCAETYGISNPVNLGIGRDGKNVFVESLFSMFEPTLFTRHSSGRLTPVDQR